MSTAPAGFASSRAGGASGSSSAASSRAKRRRAEAYAVWICVMTLVTSLNGFVYWLA